jgi:hypothetical protein
MKIEIMIIKRILEMKNIKEKINITKKINIVEMISIETISILLKIISPIQVGKINIEKIIKKKIKNIKI